jgi:hypothetical protein
MLASAVVRGPCTHVLAEKGEPTSVAGACMNFGHASNGPDVDTDSPRHGDVNLLRLIAVAKFDLALSLRLVQSSQLLAAHPPGPLRCLWLAPSLL